MMIPFFTSTYQDSQYGRRIRQKLDEVIGKGAFILGSEVKAFEEQVAAFMQSRHAIGVGNASDGLFLGVKALHLPKGSEVVTTPFTFFASTACLVRNELKPIFVDVEEETYHITPRAVADRINAKTSAVLTVDLFSHTADNDGFSELCKDAGIRFIEDAAEAFGMSWNGRRAGSLADVSAISFFPTKTLGAFGDAGIVLTQDDQVASQLKMARVHGAEKKYHHNFVGTNSRLDELQAAILNVKFQYVEQEIHERSQIAGWYKEALTDVNAIRLPRTPVQSDPVWYVYSIQAEKRDLLATYLNQCGIGTSVYYPVPMHLQKCFQDLGYREGDFPVTEKLCKSALALPLYIGMKPDEVAYVAEKIKKFYNQN